MSMVALGPIPGEICSHCPFVMWDYTSRGNLITVLVFCHPDSSLLFNTAVFCTETIKPAGHSSRATPRARGPRPAAASRCD